MQNNTFDIIVIGAGSGGLTAAVGLAKVGKKVLLVEREHLGGECTNSGCIPSKALIHHARSFYESTKISGTTAASEAFRNQAFAYVRSKIEEVLAEETPEIFEKMGITVVIGEAIFISEHSISLNGLVFCFKKAIIATGSSPRLLTIPGGNADHVLTNQNIFSLKKLPEKLLIVGAGPIGLELAQAFAMLGTKVTLVTNSTELATLEDPLLRPIITRACENLGITIQYQAECTSIEFNKATFTVKNSPDNSENIVISFDKILVAVGRVPNFPAGLSDAKIAVNAYGITIDRQYKTSNRNVYAVGDISQSLKFTHTADDTARQVVTHIVSRGLLRVGHSGAVPKVTYTTPELAQVGLSWNEAVAQFTEKNIKRIEVPFSKNDRARTDNATDGHLIVIVKRLSGKIIGAHIAGAKAGELISVFTLAIDTNLSLWRLRRTIFAYPTYSLIIKRAGDYFFAKQISELKADLLDITKKLTPKIIVITLWVSALFALYQYQTSHDLSVTDTALLIFDFLSMTTWGPLVYILAYTVRPLTFIPGTAMTILSGVFFGLWGGIIYTVIGANLSASLAYIVGRFFSGSKKEVRKSLFGRFGDTCRTNPFVSILTMRLLFLPYDAVNFGAGLLRVPFAPYITATIIGTLLGIITFVSIGASLSIEEFKTSGFTINAIDSKFLLLSLFIFVASLAISKALKKK